MLQQPSLDELQEICRQVRRDILIMLEHAGSGHPGGSLSAVEILVTLYWVKLKNNPGEPTWPERDRFILSKGHCCPVLYTVLAHRGFFPREELMTFRRLNSRLQGHAYRGTPGVEASTGSLGQGLSIANGMALAARMDGLKHRIYCLIGDGEMGEGQIWEAAMTAYFRKLSNVCAILDRNLVQQDAETACVKNLEPVPDKWRACGWKVIEVDGHSCRQLLEAYDAAEKVTDRPTMIIAHTVKGKGVSFMEGKPEWHGKAPNKEELARALAEL
ncbi:MAG: transketolase [Chloroflexi bacterium]|nr:transketolase [Chloroflexota bacterium]